MFCKNDYIFATYEKGGNLGGVIFGKTSGYVTGDVSVSYWSIFSLSPVLFRTTFTRTIILNLLSPEVLLDPVWYLFLKWPIIVY